MPGPTTPDQKTKRTTLRKSSPLPIIPLCLSDLGLPQNRIPRLSSFKSPFVKIIRNACYENIFNGGIILTTYNTVEPRLTTTSLLRPYSFKPKVKTIDSFSYFQDPVNATTSLLRPGFYGPTVVVLTGFHCTRSLKDTLGPQQGLLNYQLTTGLFRFVKQTLQLHHPRVEAFK